MKEPVKTTRLAAIWLAALYSMVSFALAQKSPSQKIDKVTNATFKDVEMDSVHVIALQGNGLALITITPQVDAAHPITMECNSINSVWCVLPKPKQMSENSNTLADVTVGLNSDSDYELTAELRTEAFLEVDNSPSWTYQSLRFPEDRTELQFEVKTNKLFPLGAKLDSYKLRFSVGGSDRSLYLPGFFSASKFLKLEVSLQKKDKPRTQAKLLSREATEIGTQVIATVFGDEDEFCASDDCSYLVKITSSMNTFLYFSLKPIEKVQKVELSSDWGTTNSYWLEDQIFNGRPSFYKFLLSEPGDLTFELMPADGNPDIYVNIGEDNDFDPNRYQYKSDSDALEDIIISRQDIEAKGEKGKEVYVIVQSKATSSYYLSGTWRSAKAEKTAMPIKLNTFYSGSLHDQEIANFILTFSPNIPELVSGYVSLKAAAGNPDLYLKDCPYEDECSITVEEIKQAKAKRKQNPNLDEDSYFIYSENSMMYDSLFFEMTMNPPGTNNTVTDESNMTVPNGKTTYYVSKFNKICVAVLGNKNSFSDKSKYSLVVSGKNGHKVITEYDTQYLFLSLKDEAYFVYKPTLIPSQAKGVIINFEASAGDLDFYYSRVNRYPSSDSNDQELLIDNDQRVSESTIRSLKIKTDDLRKEGVYFGFIAKKETLLKLMISFWLPEAKEGTKYIELIPNAPIVRNLKQISDYIDSSRQTEIFVFSTSQGDSEVFLKLKIFYGESFADTVFCAAPIKSYQDIQGSSTCQHYGMNGLLSISQKSASSSTKWAVYLTPNVSTNMKSLGAGFSYEITLLAPGAIRHIKNLGIPFEDAIIGTSYSSSSNNLHIVDFVSKQKDIHYYLIAESLNKQPLQVDISFDQANFKWNGYTIFDGDDKSYYRTLLFTSREIRKFCKPMTMDEASDYNRRLQKETEDAVDDSPEESHGSQKTGELGMPLLCRGFIRVMAPFNNNAAMTPYRLTFVKSDETIELDGSKSYSLPVPLAKPLKVRCSVGRLPNGAVVSIGRLYEQFQAFALVASRSSQDSTDVITGSMVVSTGFGTASLELTPETFDTKLIASKERNTFVYLQIDVEPEVLKRDPKTAGDPVSAEGYFTLSINTLVTPLALGETIQGRVKAGHYRYYQLAVTGAAAVTLSLQVKGNHDADLYVEKGKSFPSMVDYYLASAAYKSDELTIPSQEKADPDQQTFYTVGVYGITELSEFTLTAIQDTFQVYDPELSRVYTATVTRERPLVMRRRWDIDFVKYFYYSADSFIEVREGVEGKNGLVAALKELNLKTPQQVNTHVGKAVRYEPTKADGLEPTGRFLAFYPQDEKGSLSLVMSHLNVPIKVTPSQPPVRVVLNKGEFVLIEPFVNLGELNEFTITIGGTADYTAFTYNSK